MSRLIASFHIMNRPDDRITLTKLEESAVLTMAPDENSTYSVYFSYEHLKTLETACAHLREIIAAKAKGENGNA